MELNPTIDGNGEERSFRAIMCDNCGGTGAVDANQDTGNSAPVGMSVDLGDAAAAAELRFVRARFEGISEQYTRVRSERDRLRAQVAALEKENRRLLDFQEGDKLVIDGLRQELGDYDHSFVEHVLGSIVDKVQSLLGVDADGRPEVIYDAIAELRADKERLEALMDYIMQHGGDGISALEWSVADPEEIMEDRIEPIFDRATIDRIRQPKDQ